MLWFTPHDVEAMMETELVRAGLYPTLQKPIVDLERFITRHLRVRLDQHAELDAHLLGLTEFYPHEAPKISINRDLTNAIDEDDSAPGLLGRWRATLAHEASHVLMHRFLFDVAAEQQDLFAAGKPCGKQLMRCMKANVLFRGGGSDPREVQANMGMAALLMPVRFFTSLVKKVVDDMGVVDSELAVGSEAAHLLAGSIRDHCNVSKQAALIRLEVTGVVSARGQRRISMRP